LIARQRMAQKDRIRLALVQLAISLIGDLAGFKHLSAIKRKRVFELIGFRSRNVGHGLARLGEAPPLCQLAHVNWGVQLGLERISRVPL